MPRAIMNDRRLWRALFGCALGVTLLIAGGVGAALAGDDDDDDDTFDTKFMKGILHGLGLKSDNGPNIDYHERSPLVVPPTRDLPPPQTAGAEVTAKIPNWPKDADVERRTTSKKVKARPAVVNLEDDMRQLRPDELRKGAPAQPSPLPRQETEPKSQIMPSALGFKGFGIDSIFGRKEEVVPFTGEPPRTSLVEPPAGLRTPSPNQPYGTTGGMEPTRGSNDKERHDMK